MKGKKGKAYREPSRTSAHKEICVKKKENLALYQGDEDAASVIKEGPEDEPMPFSRGLHLDEGRGASTTRKEKEETHPRGKTRREGPKIRRRENLMLFS